MIHAKQLCVKYVSRGTKIQGSTLDFLVWWQILESLTFQDLFGGSTAKFAIKTTKPPNGGQS
jgi:hypothetical protein